MTQEQEANKVLQGCNFFLFRHQNENDHDLYKNTFLSTRPVRAPQILQSGAHFKFLLPTAHLKDKNKRRTSREPGNMGKGTKRNKKAALTDLIPAFGV